MKTLLSALYLAPIAYYKALLTSEALLLEQYNHYEKKSYQNRCEILAANGQIALSVPVEKTKHPKTPFNEVKIAYHTDWQKQHLKAIISAYQNSPFCEYYIDDLRTFYEQKYEYLLEFNCALQDKILELLDEKIETSLTAAFYQDNDVNDLRFAFHPKKKDPEKYKPYIQVFSEKLGFHPNLSILDLLFNLGPESEMYLRS